MRIAPVSMGYSNVAFNYNILSINGNPRTLGRVEAVSDVSKRNSPLIVMQRDVENSTNEDRELQPKIPSVVSGGFAGLVRQHQQTAGNNDRFNREMDIGYIRDAMNVMMMGVSRDIPAADSI